jgi:parallel beta-helix repeat protein
LVFLTALAVIICRAAVAEPRIWIVDDDGPADFQKIQDAINAAGFEDSVFVKSGTYFEELVLNKSIALLGEGSQTTYIDATGSETAIRIDSSDVNITGFTISGAGETWGPPEGVGYPDSSILAIMVSRVRIEDNVLIGAAVAVCVVNSSFVRIGNNSVQGSVYGGIVSYALTNASVSRNLVDNCGLAGIRLVAGCENVNVTENTITNVGKGVALEAGSSENRIQGNSFSGNNASIVLDGAGSQNVFRSNVMINNLHNLVVSGYSLGSFLQSIDLSNIVDGKLIYYFTNVSDRIIDPVTCPNLGFLALVNSTNVTVKDFVISDNGDGMLMAYSSSCALTNITVSYNRGPLILGGITFYNSRGNTIFGNNFIRNNFACAFYLSESNLFHRNLFIDNDLQVILDFMTPFSNVSAGRFPRSNTWDYRGEGNYWSDYNGSDWDQDGIGDSMHLLGINNIDHYPLLLSRILPDTTPPEIFLESPTSGSVIGSSTVTVVWGGYDDVSGISHYEIRLDQGPWINVWREVTHDFVGLSDGSHITGIRAYDYRGNHRETTIEISVNAEALSTLASYIAVGIAVAALAVILGVTIYFLRSRYLPRIRKTPRRLVR